MNTKIGATIPAFPNAHGYTAEERAGMDLRDWMAGQAMAAIVAKMELSGVNAPSGTGATGFSEGERVAIMKAVAKGAYDYADAMIAARSK